MPSSLVTRGDGPLKPRGGIWLTSLAVTSATAQQLVTGRTGEKIIVLYVIYSNGASSNVGMSLRWGTVGTGADYCYMVVPADGGGAVMNFVQAELNPGATGDNLYVKASAGVSTVYFSVCYDFV